ncbi:DgyrCDS7372 [Dimorphilus gyrociliatus]|uniref:DgyrCDS7372 n=1 Tax=Dimorphilus gyrociliatus TaxID=2664684 RepID=A0A7I8VTG2_9ANNE|nr:DgyrCDS7372 [Dimorphilus gyrociliatus]
MAPKPKFQEGEKLLCYHGPLLYEAKCLKIDAEEGKSIKYYVHYNGWNKSWDEWVPESRILKPNDQNIQKMKDLETSQLKKGSSKSKRMREKQIDKTKEKKKEKVEEKPPPEVTRKKRARTTTSDTDMPDAKKKKVDLETPKKQEHEEQTLDCPISIPENLKIALIEDQKQIVEQNIVCNLPQRMTIDDILNGYILYKEKDDELNKDKTKEIVEGLKEYFEDLLPKHLLYKQERSQHEELITSNPKVRFTQLYSISHFLRLFVKFGQFLPFNSDEGKDNDLKTLKGYAEDLLEFINNKNYLTSSKRNSKSVDEH